MPGSRPSYRGQRRRGGGHFVGLAVGLAVGLGDGLGDGLAVGLGDGLDVGLEVGLGSAGAPATDDDAGAARPLNQSSMFV